MGTKKAKIQIVRGLKDSLPTLLQGEIGYATDSNELFIGDPEDGNVLINTNKNPYDDTLIKNNITDISTRIHNIATEQKYTTNLNSIGTNKPLVSFIDDDGNRGVITKLLPLSQKYNIPFVSCVPSSFIGQSGNMTIDELLDLQNNKGFEIATHGKTHNVINETMTIENQHEEVYGSFRDMTKQGLNISTIVYPYGQSTSYARQLATMYYSAGVSTDAQHNRLPRITYGLKRFEFGGDQGYDLKWYKTRIDECLTNKTWCIFMMHCGFSTFDINMLDELIQYINTLNIDIVTVREGIRISGNAIEINQGQLWVATDGSNNIKDYDYKKLNTLTGNEDLNFSNSPKDFQSGKVTINAITKDVQNSPTGGRGVLKTIASENDNIASIQKFEGTNKIYRRVSISNNTSWGNWKEIQVAQLVGVFTIATFTIPAGKSVMKTVTTGVTDFNKFLLVNPTFPYTNDLIYSYGQRGSYDGIKINFYNPTQTDITLTDSTWKYIYL